MDEIIGVGKAAIQALQILQALQVIYHIHPQAYTHSSAQCVSLGQKCPSVSNSLCISKVACQVKSERGLTGELVGSKTTRAIL